MLILQERGATDKEMASTNVVVVNKVAWTDHPAEARPLTQALIDPMTSSNAGCPL